MGHSSELGSLAPDRGRHALDALSPTRLSSRVVVFHPAPEAIDALLGQARSRVQGVGSTAAVHRAIRVNPDAFWGIARRPGGDEALQPEGFLALLLLNASGREALEGGTLDVSDPPVLYLSRQDERPCAIYVWLQFAPGKLSAGMPLVLEKFSSSLYRDVDIYTRAATQDGDRFMRQVGFVADPAFAATDLHVFRRRPPVTERPIFDRYTPGASPDAAAVTVARTFDDLLCAAVIRGAVFVAEQACPFAEEFDGNDTSGHQLLGYVGDEPAGCLRVRYFAGFAKLERLAVRREYRDRRLGAELVKAGIALCRAKGYGRIYGQSQLHALGFYERLGFRERRRNVELTFSDHAYREIVLDVDPGGDAVTMDSDPYVIIRPEGRWDLPGVLDASATRPIPPVRETTPS